MTSSFCWGNATAANSPDIATSFAERPASTTLNTGFGSSASPPVALYSATSFVQAFSKLGLLPDSGGTWTLPRLVGNARALGLTLLGNKLPAEQAAAWGMIWQCVPDAELGSTVDALAESLAAAPTRGLAWTKAAIRGSWQHSLAEQLDIERDAQRELGRSTDYAEGVAAFVEKRSPRFTGR